MLYGVRVLDRNISNGGNAPGAAPIDNMMEEQPSLQPHHRPVEQKPHTFTEKLESRFLFFVFVFVFVFLIRTIWENLV